MKPNTAGADTKSPPKSGRPSPTPGATRPNPPSSIPKATPNSPPIGQRPAPKTGPNSATTAQPGKVGQPTPNSKQPNKTGQNPPGAQTNKAPLTPQPARPNQAGQSPPSPGKKQAPLTPQPARPNQAGQSPPSPGKKQAPVTPQPARPNQAGQSPTSPGKKQAPVTPQTTRPSQAKQSPTFPRGIDAHLTSQPTLSSHVSQPLPTEPSEQSLNTDLSSRSNQAPQSQKIRQPSSSAVNAEMIQLNPTPRAARSTHTDASAVPYATPEEDEAFLDNQPNDNPTVEHGKGAVYWILITLGAIALLGLMVCAFFLVRHFVNNLSDDSNTECAPSQKKYLIEWYDVNTCAKKRCTKDSKEEVISPGCKFVKNKQHTKLEGKCLEASETKVYDCGGGSKCKCIATSSTEAELRTVT
jgi:hypothetical protein